VNTPGASFSQSLRGYDDNWEVGTQVARVGAAYRFPIIPLYYNSNATAPFYLQQIFGELFYEGGEAWGAEPGRGDPARWLNALGAEINGSVTVFRFFDVAPGVGVAYAPQRAVRATEDDPYPSNDDDQKWVIYLSVKGSVNF